MTEHDSGVWHQWLEGGYEVEKSARAVAEYFLANDASGKLKDKTIVTRNGRRFYAGNARLNKYLHIAQNLYIAKYGQKLFSDSLYAYDNGAVVPDVQENYSIMISRDPCSDMDKDTAVFLDCVMALLENATLDELIQISHEDSEWRLKNNHFEKKDQEMDSLSHIDEYREQYADALLVLEGMANA